jgi:hypothetical protein
MTTKAQNKRTQRSVARVEQRAVTRKQTNDARSATAVHIPLEHVVPWRDAGVLKRLHPVTSKTFKGVLRTARQQNIPTAMVVHDRDCRVTVSRWPRDERAEGADIMSVVVEACTCAPLVMYTGARA